MCLDSYLLRNKFQNVLHNHSPDSGFPNVQRRLSGCYKNAPLNNDLNTCQSGLHKWCGKEHVGQTGGCLNDCLREHFYNTHRVVAGHLGIYCPDCGCVAHFETCSVIDRVWDTLTREIMKAQRIEHLKDKCASSPSIALSTKELQFLSKR